MEVTLMLKQRCKNKNRKTKKGKKFQHYASTVVGCLFVWMFDRALVVVLVD